MHLPTAVKLCVCVCEYRQAVLSPIGQTCRPVEQPAGSVIDAGTFALLQLRFFCSRELSVKCLGSRLLVLFNPCIHTYN
eukprot:1157284-Pelagomonas_calceolata.AAC.2